jgi:hypothetical protein
MCLVQTISACRSQSGCSSAVEAINDPFFGADIGRAEVRCAELDVAFDERLELPWVLGLRELVLALSGVETKAISAVEGCGNGLSSKASGI